MNDFNSLLFGAFFAKYASELEVHKTIFLFQSTIFSLVYVISFREFARKLIVLEYMWCLYNSPKMNLTWRDHLKTLKFGIHSTRIDIFEACLATIFPKITPKSVYWFICSQQLTQFSSNMATTATKINRSHKKYRNTDKKCCIKRYRNFYPNKLMYIVFHITTNLYMSRKISDFWVCNWELVLGFHWDCKSKQNTEYKSLTRTTL